MGMPSASAMSIDLLLCSAEPPSLEISRKPAAHGHGERGLPAPLDEKVLAKASAQLAPAARATLEACLMAYKIHKISPTDLLAFCRSMATYSPALDDVFSPRAERLTLFAADDAEGFAKRKPVAASPEESPSKRHSSFGDNMAAQALMSLMSGRGASASPPPEGRESPLPAVDYNDYNQCTISPIQSLIKCQQQPVAASGRKENDSRATGASAAPSPGSFASAKQCKSRKASLPRVAIPQASSGGKARKQDKEASSEDDTAQSSRSTPSAESSAREATPPSPAEESGAAHNKYCHFCQHVKVKRASSMISCDNKGCNRRFCEYCLNTHVRDAQREDGQPWHCPICRKSCCCTMRECTQNHRHCKAYRYRRKRAAQADVDVSGSSVASNGMFLVAVHEQGHAVRR
uniref:RING-type domain-containing protein n=1 Tax=Hemiselmis tepida TaxID=464990 RepID=A0A7S0VWP4_9CRYP